MFNTYSVGPLTIAPALVLAPMSGVTTSAFRRLIKELNPGAVGLVITEFISVEAMTRQVPRTLAMMKYVLDERPFGIQIFGHDITRMRDSARMCEDAGSDIVDINCGCPAPKVVKKGGGCELMRQPEHLAQILKAVRSAISVPLTMKFRSGWDAQNLNALEIAKIAESEGVNAITIHGRTRSQLYRGEADWSIIQEVKETVNIPVLGSGDVTDRESAELRLQFGADGIFIGRAALSNPFVFSDIVNGTKTKLRSEPLKAVQVLERYIELLKEEFSPKASVGKVKQLCSQMCCGLEWRKPILVSESLLRQEDLLRETRFTLEDRSASKVCTDAAIESAENDLSSLNVPLD